MSRQSEWQKRQVELGNCRQCGLPRDGPSIAFCVDCLVKQRILQRTRLGYKKQVNGQVGRPPECAEDM